MQLDWFRTPGVMGLLIGTESTMEKHLQKLLVTPTSFAADELEFARVLLEESGYEVVYNQSGKPLETEQLVAAACGCVGILAGLDDFSASVLKHLPDLRVISRYGVGVDRIDMQAACRNGIVVTNTPGANSIAVAEMALTGMFALARHVTWLNETTRQGKWSRVGGTELSKSTLGIVGYGSIGRALRKIVTGLEMKVLVYDPFFDPDTDPTVQCVELTDLVRESNFISLHLPLTPATERLFDASLFRLMSPGAFLINTSRGGIVDESAAAKALESGQLAGFALDAYEEEPPSPDHELFHFPNVIATPHSGAQTVQSHIRMARGAVENLLGALTGKPVTNLASNLVS